ncbi:MAG: PKD domain-containing protein [Candidatus Vogelbacteria bacterium]|nr:PKD domain-containing protein [Candidatus Vogelbacteria bacterium]
MAAAVSVFQLKYKNEILAPLGLTNPTGYVGPATRKKLNQLYGCNRMPPIPGNLPPTISGVSGPTTLNVGQAGTWTVQASDPENGPLSYSVIWGDEVTVAPMAGSPAASAVQQTATFTHAYARAGTYYPRFKVTDNAGQSNSTSLSVVVGPNQFSNHCN